MSSLEKFSGIQRWIDAGYEAGSRIQIIIKSSPLLDIETERVESVASSEATQTLRRRSVWSGMLSFRPWADHGTRCLWLFAQSAIAPGIPAPNMTAQFGPYSMYLWLIDKPLTFVAWQRAMMGLDKAHGGKPRWYSEKSSMLLPGAVNWKGNPPAANIPAWHHEDRYSIIDFPVHVPPESSASAGADSSKSQSHLPQSFIDEVLGKTDLTDIVAKHVQLKKAGADLVGLCPFHHEKTPSFSVSPDKQLYYCFGCGKGGGAVQFLEEHDGYSFREAIEYLAEKLGMEIPSTTPEDDASSKQRSVALATLGQAAQLLSKELLGHGGAGAREYLKGRGMNKEIAIRYGIGYAPPGYDFMKRHFQGKAPMSMLKDVGLVFQNQQGGYGDMFRDRVMFPIRDRRGQVVGFGGRVMGVGEPKYLNTADTPYFHKSELLYGYYEHRDEIRRLKGMLVVEGYMDVLSCSLHGLPIAVAPLGTSISEHQIREILRTNPTPVFCFDGDKAGRQAAWRALEKMLPVLDSEQHAPRFLFLPEGDDPDSLLRSEGKDGFVRRVESQSRTALDTWLVGLKLLIGKQEGGRASMAKKADQMLATMNDRYLQQEWRQEAERATGIQLQD